MKGSVEQQITNREHSNVSVCVTAWKEESRIAADCVNCARSTPDSRHAVFTGGLEDFAFG